MDRKTAYPYVYGIDYDPEEYTKPYNPQNTMRSLSPEQIILQIALEKEKKEREQKDSKGRKAGKQISANKVNSVDSGSLTTKSA